MTDYSRRKFLKQIFAGTALVFTSRQAFSLPDFLADEKDFEMLVVGDSIIWGQGLKEENKFYTLTKNWLRQEIFGESRKVNLKNKSHSGARIFLDENEKAALEKAGREPDEFHYSEMNVSFPSIKTQIDVAEREYKAVGKRAEDINLIMLTGGLANLSTSYILDAFEKNEPLRKIIDEVCNEMMFKLLQHASETFPNAQIAVIGYFPIVSKHSSTGKVYNGILELYDVPSPLKPIMNNILTKQFFKIVHKKMNKRSRIWFEESTKALNTAVKRLNETRNEQRAVFVKSPITEKNCYGTENSLLWDLGKKGRMNDETADVR